MPAAFRVQTMDGHTIDCFPNDHRTHGKLTCAVLTSPQKTAALLVLHNQGRPSFKRISGHEPSFLRSWTVATEGTHRIWRGDDQDIRPKLKDGAQATLGDLLVWHALDVGSDMPEHSLHPESHQYFTVDGGRQLWLWVTRDGKSPWPKLQSIPDNKKTALRNFLQIDVGNDRNYSTRVSMRRSYAEDGEQRMRDFYPVTSRGLCRHGKSVYGFGRIYRGDGVSNGHYDQLRWFIESALILEGQGEQALAEKAWALACVHFQHRITQGTVCSEGHGLDYDQCYEKSTASYCGESSLPEESHTWITGLVSFAFLVKGVQPVGPLVDTFTERIAKVVCDPMRFPWNRKYGVRRFGWALENLLALYQLRGDPRAKDRAKQLIADAYGYVGQDPTFLNAATRMPSLDPWQNGITASGLLRWYEVTGTTVVPEAVRERTLDMVHWDYRNLWGAGGMPYKAELSADLSAVAYVDRKFGDTITPRYIPAFWYLKQARNVSGPWQDACDLLKQAPPSTLLSGHLGTERFKNGAGFLYPAGRYL